jgi:hypothetical protein
MSTVELINEITWMNQIEEYMSDDEVDKVLASVAKLIAKPDVPPSVAAQLIVQLQAYAFKFGMLATWYTNVKKDERGKKNFYYTLAERTDRLVDSLKYVARNYG